MCWKWLVRAFRARWSILHVQEQMEFLTVLNQDVEIMIRPRANSSETGHISVLAVQ